MKCYMCDEKLIWEGDHDHECNCDEKPCECYKMMTILNCKKCETLIKVYSK